jgi:Ribonuclease G/E
MTRKEPTAQEIKDQMDDLRLEWDRLDNEGSQAEKQSQISQRIGILQKQLKDLYGEDY